MRKIKEVIKLLLKFVYINDITKFHIGRNSGVGAFSRIIFSSDYKSNKNQSIQIGMYAGVGRSCELQVWENNHIVIKDYSTVSDGCKILGDVTIERYCLLSSNIFASSGNHYATVKPSWLIKDQDQFVLNTKEGKDAHSIPIRVEEDCWIGYGVFIKQGINIGRGSIIGANSSVIKDTMPYTISAGSPAKELKKRFEFSPPVQISCDKDTDLPYFYRGFNHRQDILDESRESFGIIHSYHESVVLLKKGNFDTICVEGKGHKSIGIIQLNILWNDQLQWTVDITSQNFAFSLSDETAGRCSMETLLFYNSIGKTLRSNYNSITFFTREIKGIDMPFGINTVKISQS